MTSAAVLLAAAGCGAGTDDGRSRTLAVFAAASLQEPFEQIADVFEAEHPGVDVVLSSGGSSTLVEQVRQGAPADVLATADTTTMDSLPGATPEPMASNALTIAVPEGNPAGIADLASLARPGVQLVICAPAVPCGAATVRAEEASGVELSPVSEEQSVTDVLNKVSSGQADAGIVYVTDVARAGEAVEEIAMPEAAGIVNRYPITVVEGTEQEELAASFVDLVTGDEGQAILAEHGFGAP